MKVFLIKNKIDYDREEHDHLIIAKTKKEAMVHFNDFKEHTFQTYLTKDFKELEVKDLKVSGLNIRPYFQKEAIDWCFDIELSISLKEHVPYNKEMIVETEQTYKELIKMFKQQNKEFLKEYF